MERALVVGQLEENGIIHELHQAGENQRRVSIMKRQKKAGFTLVEIMIVVAIIALLAAIAIPNVLRSRTTANEASSISNLRALVASLEMYRSVNSEYPDDWTADMYTGADPDFGPPSFSLDLEAANASNIQGYTYNYNRLTTQTYVLNSNPETDNRTGTRSFWADESGQIFHCDGDNTSDAAVNGAAVSIDQPVVACS